STIDYIALVKEMPKTDQRIEALNLVKCGGGPAANAAVAANKLGAKCSIISVVGNDSEGNEIIEELNQKGIDTSGIQTSLKGKTPQSLIHVERNTGYRSITHYGEAIQYFDFNNYPLELLRNCSLVHADGNSVPLTLHTFQQAKKLGITTLLDGGNITESNLSLLLPFTDIFITDIKSIPYTMKDIGIKTICKKLAESGPHTVCITLGKEGSVLYDSTQFLTTKSYKVKVVDTTGAGDNFHGAYAFAYWYGLPLQECLQLSNVFAGLSCKNIGGRSNLKSFEEIKNYYKD